MTEGVLYVVATPIGNLEDITLRALRVLKEVDLIACEDTRRTRKLLAHYGIEKPMESYYEEVEVPKSRRLAELIASGKSVALVSDAGTPAISDPGYRLIKLCAERGIKIVPVPGPVAFAAAISASGLPTDSFSFYGFIPARRGARRRFLERLRARAETLIFYESPARIVAALEDMRQILGDRRAVVARELTKIYEEFLRGRLGEIIERLQAMPEVKGEVTIIVAGAEEEETGEKIVELPIEEHLKMVMERTGLPRREALRVVARERGLSRREAYRLLLEKKKPKRGARS